MYSRVLRSLCERSRGDLEGSKRCGQMPVVQDAALFADRKWWGLVCFDHTRFERFDIVRTAFYRAVPTETLLRLC
jgi:hypothetical protein